MSAFQLTLRDSRQCQVIEQVQAFIGRDSSGWFSLWPGHVPFQAILQPGLARYRQADGKWIYLALPDGLLSCRDHRLQLSTRRYLADADYQTIVAALDSTLAAESQSLQHLKANLGQLEEEIMRRLLRTGTEV